VASDFTSLRLTTLSCVSRWWRMAGVEALGSP